MQMNVFITGISSGIGEALAKKFATQGHQVYGLSRRAINFSHKNIHHQQVDLLSDYQIELPENIDIAILNAGVLGGIEKIQQASTNQLKSTMEMNLWSQKKLIDYLLEKHQIAHIWGISSGAALKGGKGWSGYSLSKAAFKILMELYSQELTEIQFLNIAPGLIDTAMQDYLCSQVDYEKFPALQRMTEARSNGSMLKPDALADKFYALTEKLKT